MLLFTSHLKTWKALLDSAILKKEQYLQSTESALGCLCFLLASWLHSVQAQDFLKHLKLYKERLFQVCEQKYLEVLCFCLF